MDYKFIISIIALVVSIVSLGWNIYNKIKNEKKKLLIQSYKSKSQSKESFLCVVTLTNIGNKPIFIRRIELEEKVNGKEIKRHLDYNKYHECFKNNPINPEHWKTLIFDDTQYFGFYDAENKKFKKTKITVVDPKGKTYSTKWFCQNNLN